MFGAAGSSIAQTIQLALTVGITIGLLFLERQLHFDLEAITA